jgi:Na+-transporting methylmalonyl-CoA/oxaloacetate decarboxylase gamma subunit
VGFVCCFLLLLIFCVSANGYEKNTQISMTFRLLCQTKKKKFTNI